MINWSEFHFLRPEAFLLLLALPIIIGLLYKKRGQTQEWADVCDPELLPYVVEGQTVNKSSLGWLWIVIASIPAIIALAGPVWERVPQPVFDETAALVILLDTSRSMDAEDIKPSRMDRAKLKVLDVLKQRETGQTALIAYAADPYVVSPLTSDAKTIEALVPSLSTEIMPRQGSNVSKAINKAIELLNNAGAKGHILLISDGAANQSLTDAIKNAQASRTTISVIGIGTNNGAPIPTRGGFLKDKSGNIVVVKQEVASLRKLANEGSGRYSNLTANDSDIKITAQSSVLAEHEFQSTELEADQWEEQGPWLLLPVMLIALLCFRRGVLAVGFIVPFLLVTPESHAFEWQDLFRNSDQQGEHRFQQENYEESAELFNTPEWKASAQYRAGDYEGAVETLKDINHAEANYNRGNALAKLGKTKEAISAYKETLLQDKNHEDAKYNLELLENQQQQNSENSESSDSDQQDKNDSNQENSQQENSDQSQSDQNQEQSNQENTDQEKSDQDQSDQQDSQQQSEQDQQSQEQNPQDQDQSQQQNNSENEETEGEESAQQGQQEQEQDSESDAQDYQEQYQDKTEQEIEQATQQWLRRIPDKPGNLLRNQFENEYRRNQQSQQPQEDLPW